jgi:hypothetical protein
MKDLSVNNRLFLQDGGKTRIKVNKLSIGQQFKFQTPTAVCSVRGTEFGLEIGPDKSTMLRVFEGCVNASRFGAAAAEEVPVNPNQRLSIGQNQVIGKPSQMSPVELKNEQIIRFNDEAVEKGCSIREATKLTKALTKQNVTGVDISAAIDLVDMAVKQGLNVDEAIAVVSMELTDNSDKLSGEALMNVIGNKLSARIEKRGDNMKDGKDLSRTAKERSQELIRSRYGESTGAVAPGDKTPDDEMDQRKMRR